jgi:ATP-dependent Lhr-like helicase
MGGRVLGEVEEWFLSQLMRSVTRSLQRRSAALRGLDEFGALATRAKDRDPKIPSYQGGKFPLSTYLAKRVRACSPIPLLGHLPRRCATGCRPAALPRRWCRAKQMLVETFPRADKHYMVCYPFEGRLAHQTLGMLLTRRLERAGLQPMGFVASEYALVIWMVRDMGADHIGTGRLSLAGFSTRT